MLIATRYLQQINSNHALENCYPKTHLFQLTTIICGSGSSVFWLFKYEHVFMVRWRKPHSDNHCSKGIEPNLLLSHIIIENENIEYKKAVHNYRAFPLRHVKQCTTGSSFVIHFVELNRRLKRRKKGSCGWISKRFIFVFSRESLLEMRKWYLGVRKEIWCSGPPEGKCRVLDKSLISISIRATRAFSHRNMARKRIVLKCKGWMRSHGLGSKAVTSNILNEENSQSETEATLNRLICSRQR